MSAPTTDIGYAKQMQYGSPKARRHSVRKDENGRWITVCTGKSATREYKGWAKTVNCRDCRKELGVDDDD